MRHEPSDCERSALRTEPPCHTPPAPLIAKIQLLLLLKNNVFSAVIMHTHLGGMFLVLFYLLLVILAAIMLLLIVRTLMAIKRGEICVEEA